MEDSLLDSFYNEEVQALEDAKIEFEDAVKNGERRIYALDLIMSPVLDMLDSESESMTLYLKYIDYLNTFDKEAAYDAMVAMDNKCGFKFHIVISTAYVLEKELGKALTLETINLVATLNRWKEKVVGLIYSSFPWNEHTSNSDLLKKILDKAKEIKGSANYDTRLERYIDMLDVFPSETPHDPTDKDIELITNALDLLFTYKDRSAEERIEALKTNKLAWRVRFQEIASLVPIISELEKGSDLEKEYNAWMSL